MSRRKARPLHPELMEELNDMHVAAADKGDGAWWALMEDTVTNYNYRTGHGYDPFETVHKWVRTSGHFELVDA
ncbi:TPA: hypothetical protein UOA81_000860 [Stenotrophomonas maltophilia]|nr:hypothetical protein [Stenotrophomonas maltophilia]